LQAGAMDSVRRNKKKKKKGSSASNLSNIWLIEARVGGGANALISSFSYFF
jgi:hypothetical protein